jgi:hypothetical protein
MLELFKGIYVSSVIVSSSLDVSGREPGLSGKFYTLPFTVGTLSKYYRDRSLTVAGGGGRGGEDREEATADRNRPVSNSSIDPVLQV